MANKDLFLTEEHALNFFNRYDQSSSLVNYIFHEPNSVSAEEGNWPVVTMLTDPSCLYDVPRCIPQTLFERSGYANKYIRLLESVLIDIIQIPRELSVSFDLGVFVVPRILTKVSDWRKQILCVLALLLYDTYNVSASSTALTNNDEDRRATSAGL